MTNTGERLRDLYYEYAWVTEKGNIIPLWSDIAFLYLVFVGLYEI